MLLFNVCSIIDKVQQFDNMKEILMGRNETKIFNLLFTNEILEISKEDYDSIDQYMALENKKGKSKRLEELILKKYDKTTSDK